jgi:hypothetical protein
MRRLTRKSNVMREILDEGFFVDVFNTTIILSVLGQHDRFSFSESIMLLV